MKKLPVNFTLDQLRNTPAGRLPNNSHLFESPKKGSKRNNDKYRNRKVILDGKTFDSKKEARRYVELRMLLTIGEIQDLKCQVTYELSVCKYVADFTYLKDSTLIVEDVKSPATRKNRAYRIKNKLMKAEHNITIVEI